MHSQLFLQTRKEAWALDGQWRPTGAGGQATESFFSMLFLLAHQCVARVHPVQYTWIEKELEMLEDGDELCPGLGIVLWAIEIGPTLESNTQLLTPLSHSSPQSEVGWGQKGMRYANVPSTVPAAQPVLYSQDNAETFSHGPLLPHSGNVHDWPPPRVEYRM